MRFTSQAVRHWNCILATHSAEHTCNYSAMSTAHIWATVRFEIRDGSALATHLIAIQHVSTMSCTCAMSVGVDYVPGLVMSSSTVGYNVRKLLLDLGAGRNSTPIIILQQNFNCKSSNRQHILSRQLCGRFFEQRQLQLSNGRYTLKVYKQATLAEKTLLHNSSA